MKKVNTNKRQFRDYLVEYANKDSILNIHDLEKDFNEQDMHISVLLQKTNGNFIKAGEVIGLDCSGVTWQSGYNPDCKDQLYVITINDYIVKYGMTETGLKKRHLSLLTGKPEYSKNNKNSETNRRSYSLIERALKYNKKINYYASNISIQEIQYVSIDGEICKCKVAPTREEELKLAKIILQSTNFVQPLLNVQIPGGNF